MEIEIKLLELMAQKKIRHLTDLSKISNVTVQSLYNITNKKNEGMRLDTIVKLCKALECEIGDLIVFKEGEV